MRNRPWLTVLLLALLPAAPAWGQVVNNFGGANPTRIVNQPILVPPGGPQPAATPQSRPWSGFSLGGLLSGSWRTPPGRNTTPRPGKAAGPAHPRAFGFSRPAPVEP
jgi:hypothetical protein